MKHYKSDLWHCFVRRGMQVLVGWKLMTRRMKTSKRMSQAGRQPQMMTAQQPPGEPMKPALLR